MAKKDKKRKKKLYPSNHPQEPTRHHIVPKSRENNNGICIVPRAKHQTYHDLFLHLTPDKIIRHLVENYWNGQWKWVFKAIREELAKKGR